MNYSPRQFDIKAIEAEIIEETDRQHEAVATGNNELAQMLDLSIKGLKLRRVKLLERSKQS
jgi:hypothetical protein